MNEGRALWSRQIRALLAMEFLKSFLGWRSLRTYVLASLPVLLMLIRFLVPMSAEEFDEMGEPTLFYAVVYEVFILRFIVFFACVGIFSDLFRGEVTERSLHYYFLTPVRREVLAAGKFLTGLIGACVIFGGTTALSYLLMLAKHGSANMQEYLFNGPGMNHLVLYVGITVLACVGYGAVFLGIGLLFKNPVIPAAAIFGWEWINFLLPSLLKKISVVHYLRSLLPVAVDEGPFALIAEPTSAWISIPGFIIFSAILLGVAALGIRRMEIRYESD